MSDRKCLANGNLVLEFLIFKWHRLQSVIPELVDHGPGKRSQAKVCATWWRFCGEATITSHPAHFPAVDAPP